MLKCEPRLLGLSMVVGRALEPPHGARGRSGVPLTFCATLALPFRSEGGVEYARLPSVGASGDISDELLSSKRVEARAPFARGWLAVQRRTPRVPEGFSSGCRGRSLGPDGSVPPNGGIPFGDLPAGLGHDTGRARIGSPVVVPDSFALGQLSKPLGAQPSNPWTVTGSGRLSLFWVQEEPPSLRTEREGGQGSP